MNSRSFSDCLRPIAPNRQPGCAQVLRVGSYQLRPLLHIRRDDLRGLLGPRPGVYICNCPEQAWFDHFGIPVLDYRATVEKKVQMFSNLAAGSIWLSPTSPRRWGDSIRNWQSARMLHLGAGPLCGRAAQVVHTLQLIWRLATDRSKYAYVLVYNFYLPIFLAGIYAKYVLGKPLYVEYEDDYTKRRKNPIKNLLERLLRKTCCGAICVNEHMASSFENKPVVVCNGFADLSYTESCNFSIREGMTFLFGGTLDAIRGVDLIPDLVTALESHIRAFRILITGSGPLRGLVESWNIPQVTYCGVLNEQAYNEAIASADACLVLQKPDHPFSRGSFPSKIEHYARQKKPIFVLSLV